MEMKMIYVKVDIEPKEQRLKKSRYQVFHNDRKLDIVYLSRLNGKWYVEESGATLLNINRRSCSTRRDAAMSSYLSNMFIGSRINI